MNQLFDDTIILTNNSQLYEKLFSLSYPVAYYTSKEIFDSLRDVYYFIYTISDNSWLNPSLRKEGELKLENDTYLSKIIVLPNFLQELYDYNCVWSRYHSTEGSYESQGGTIQTLCSYINNFHVDNQEHIITTELPSVVSSYQSMSFFEKFQYIKRVIDSVYYITVLPLNKLMSQHEYRRAIYQELCYYYLHHIEQCHTLQISLDSIWCKIS